LAAQAGLRVKSGLMVGHGETRDELLGTFRDLRATGCSMLTVGQYLPPSPRHLPLQRFYSPAEFSWLEKEARAMGFSEVASGPLVRSSYQADKMAERVNR